MGPPFADRVRRRGDTGGGSVLAIGFFLLGLALTGLAYDTTRVIIVRRDLQSAADAAALAGASRIDQRAWRQSSGHDRRLDADAAVAEARRVFGLQAPSGTSVEVAATRERVVVRAEARVAFLILPMVGIDSAVATASARAAPRSPY